VASVVFITTLASAGVLFMTPQGWIKIHRRILLKGYANKPAYVALWVHLLLMVNHQEKEFLWNGKLIKIKAGQFVTGRKTLSEQVGISESMVERLLTFFEKESQIEQQKTTKYRLITILKWNDYQILDNKRTTSEQQVNTNKNVKKEKNQGKTSLLPLKDNNDDMGWNKTSDDFEEGVVDLDTGILTDPVKEAHEKNKELNTRKKELVDWLIKYQNRDPVRTNRPKQIKAINRLIEMKVTGKEAQEIIIQQMDSDFWREKKEKPDFSTVVAVIEKRGE
jgi:hypothetical protein